MKIFPAVVLSGAVLTAVVAGVSGYSLRSRATAGFDTNAVSAGSTSTLATAVRGLGPASTVQSTVPATMSAMSTARG